MRPQIVLFGDSITQQSFRSGGWGASLADIYSRKADVVLRGYGGYNTRWALFLLHHLFPLGSATPPIAVTIFFGANDAALLEGTGKKQHVPLEEYSDNLTKMVQHIKNWSSSTLIVLITPPPIDLQGRREYARSLYGDKASELPDRTNEVTGTYAEQCVSLAKELGLPSINLWSKMQETEGCDGLHLTPEGNAIVFQEVHKIFDEAGFSDLPFDFPPHSEIDGENPEKAFLQQCAAV
ncbi:Isoamyl acetate-hydrolyzing esterase [Handroanthus impetiginosus]|uniref:Isoamyl acetate-hydrolyzing esterase n=1 Tax=Handroanthus impetiginosus TaxID=429701 RepID=A0A2G9I1B6_9LAMI|nr:Isoamyl acetate-hydrolyzing esterase [Handroanthus impetiginosus]